MKRLVFSLIFLCTCSLWCSEYYATVPAYWDGQFFHECNLNQTTSQNRIIEGTTIYVAAGHIACYGHALLDGVFPLYVLLKNYDLLNTPINFAIEVNSYIEQNATFNNILKLIKDIFRVKQVILLHNDQPHDRPIFEKLIVNKHVPFQGAQACRLSFYGACPETFEYILTLRSFGFRENVIFQDTHTNDNLVKEFVNFVRGLYKINLPMVKKRVLIAYRPTSRKILNIKDLIKTLRFKGYDPVTVDFEKLSIEKQIIETVQSEYLIGTYGSNLVNAIFLKPQANVVVLWHPFAKYFWSRRYCIIHSAFLAMGVKLIEYDQPDYHPFNLYPERIQVSDYFYRENNKNILRPEKINMDSIVNYPLPAMYEITNVDLYIDPKSLVDQLETFSAN